MGVIAIIGTIISVLKAIPDIVRLVKAIIDMLRQLKPGVDQKALLAEFREALNYAKQTKDTSKLEAFHAKLVSCVGGSCEPGGVQ